MLVQWLTKIAQDPESLANLGAIADRSSMFANVMPSPASRLAMLRLIKERAYRSRNDCEKVQPSGNDLAALAKTLSPKDFRNTLDVIDIVVRQRSVQPGEGERYTVAELLDVDAHINAIEPPKSLSNGSEFNPCAVFAFSIETVEALPEPERQRATYEFYRFISGGKVASERVLDDPAAYLDDVFDERRLPDSIRRHLPPDGSRPLPYSRLIVDGEWVNKTTPADSAPYTDTYVNRRNNGVLAELMTSPNSSGKTNWSNFAVTYGIAELLSQTVASNLNVSRLATLKDDKAIAIANEPMFNGKHIEISVPQPSRKGQLSRRCEIGKTVSASTIFGTLTGEAVELDCSKVRKNGTTSRVRAVWLTDYGIELSRTIDDEDGRTDVIIKNVTIVKP
ncbi:hypothetical protein CJO71_16280 [Burkholderia ubonensis]|uniref:Uncharacterized protein n=2 Tax=Burkholderia ubonensis TaxID=101571 RepID=A0AB74DE81_9BURK|nr:hypothetical protein CJO71_16280 [Burkholderia ubonensis]PAJ90167.1 hypothetical protein CJO70_02225 [Burkholderia ubonensis]PAJ96207.1 hypothetical protein CJO69_00355 [Burkholderia ubonensis]PAK03071.1 hypothetical protein CJO68_02245 [Burkholderia ubonensis]PAK07704.1 hypothetical protein CJO67_13740 [Burkholderia ubonensis]